MNVNAVFIKHRSEQWIDSLWIIEASAKERLAQLTKSMVGCGVPQAVLEGWITTIKLEDGRMEKK